MQSVLDIFLHLINHFLLLESIVFLDRVNNIPSKFIVRTTVPQKRIFTLSDYGAYLFLLKLSIHFTRIKDNVERKSINQQ